MYACICVHICMLHVYMFIHVCVCVYSLYKCLSLGLFSRDGIPLNSLFTLACFGQNVWLIPVPVCISYQHPFIDK